MYSGKPFHTSCSLSKASSSWPAEPLEYAITAATCDGGRPAGLAQAKGGMPVTLPMY